MASGGGIGRGGRGIALLQQLKQKGKEEEKPQQAPLQAVAAAAVSAPSQNKLTKVKLICITNNDNINLMRASTRLMRASTRSIRAPMLSNGIQMPSKRPCMVVSARVVLSRNMNKILKKF